MQLITSYSHRIVIPYIDKKYSKIDLVKLEIESSCHRLIKEALVTYNLDNYLLKFSYRKVEENIDDGDFISSELERCETYVVKLDIYSDIFNVNDKVIITSNGLCEGLYIGDLGTITYIDESNLILYSNNKSYYIPKNLYSLLTLVTY